MEGREAIRALLEGPVHQGYVESGCGHMTTLPLLRIEGDRAVGIAYHRLHRHESTGYDLVRLTASRWEWRREATGEWRIVRRVHRLLDGSQAARDLLKDTLSRVKRGSGERTT
jgi:hypothetical protein